MHLASQLTAFLSHAAIAVVAILGWVFVVMPLWRRYSTDVSRVLGSLRSAVFSLKNPLGKWIAVSGVLLGVFAVGLWIGWHKELGTAAVTKLFQKAPRAAAVSPAPVEQEPSLSLAVASPPPALTPATSTTSVADRLLKESTLGISEVTVSEMPDPDSATNLRLRITVKKQPNAAIDHTKVKIQVFFYDTVGDNDIKLTDADVSYEWLTPNHDSNRETLAVTYIRPKSKAKPPEIVRKYLGYIVRVYYNDQLQDQRADPMRLLTLFPANGLPPPAAPGAPPARHIDEKISQLLDQAGRTWLDQKEFQQARQAYQRRDFASALKFVNDADAVEPNQPATLTLRGEILIEQKQFDQAEAEFKKALKADPKFRVAQYDLALVPLKKKDYATARDRFEELLSKTTPGGEKSQAAQIIKFNIYMTLLLGGKEDRARKMMEQFRLNSETPILFYAKAAWEFKHSNPAKAVDLISTAKKDFSSTMNLVFADSFYDLGWLQSPAVATSPAPTAAADERSPQQGSNAPSRSANVAQTQVSPAVVGGFLIEYSIRNRCEQAVATLTRLIEKNPKDAHALAERGYNYSLLGDFTKAIADYEAALKLNPDDHTTAVRLESARAIAELGISSPSEVIRNGSSREQSSSPYATAADFARYSMKLREQVLLNVEPIVNMPTSSRPAAQRYPWKSNIVTTVFWIGEKSGKHVNFRSAWDQNWQANYGGFDNPDRSARRSYIPVGFIPRQNPFYCALPYNDVTHGQFKPEAPLVIPWFKQAYYRQGQSVCWHRWIAIRKGNRTCCAQWEDVGPFREDHFQYVFGNERPKPNLNHGAGLNVSPAVRDYLGLQPTDVTDWQFVNTQDVPAGPWRSYGDNNNFVIARRAAEQRSIQQQGGVGAAPLPSPAQSTATPR